MEQLTGPLISLQDRTSPTRRVANASDARKAGTLRWHVGDFMSTQVACLGDKGWTGTISPSTQHPKMYPLRAAVHRDTQVGTHV